MNKHNFSNKRSYAKAYRQCMREDILGQLCGSYVLVSVLKENTMMCDTCDTRFTWILLNEKE